MTRPEFCRKCDALAAEYKALSLKQGTTVGSLNYANRLSRYYIEVMDMKYDVCFNQNYTDEEQISGYYTKEAKRHEELIDKWNAALPVMIDLL